LSGTKAGHTRHTVFSDMVSPVFLKTFGFLENLFGILDGGIIGLL
jgi:hypothetical protein